MIISFIYVLLAILGLSFLIFIHELGHYWMARRVGMRVETFAIGFGKPMYSWERDGVQWQIGWLLFGGYVKIAGTETEGDVDPYDVPDGFFGKGPWDRIKVAFAGPFVNLLFAFIVFVLLWLSGGREKDFAEFTHKIGWLDPKSELYAAGLRPGDEITAYGDYQYQSFKDHLYAPMVTSGPLEVSGKKIDYRTGEETSFEYSVAPYPHPYNPDESITTAGILSPASYVIYDKLPDGEENPLPEGSPLRGSGIHYGDRLLWVDGEQIFSLTHLSKVLNDDRVLVTVKRGDKEFLRRVPRVPAQDLRPDAEFREELIDWQFEAGLRDTKFHELYAIPYNLSYDGTVESVLRFVDQQDQVNAFPEHPYSEHNEPLQAGDRIVAVQGVPVDHSHEILKEIQEKKVNIIVQRDALDSDRHHWVDADEAFYENVDMNDLAKIADSVGSESPVKRYANLALLRPVTPKVRTEFPMSEEAKAWLEAERLEQQKNIQKIEDPEERRYRIKMLEESEKLVALGLPNPQDLQVQYNPPPTQMFQNVAQEIWRTLQALFSGALSPKYITGPVGIVHVVQRTSMVSMKETLFWIAAISLNLGFLNLLPIPILDGGTIVFSFFEMVSGRRIHPRVLEKIIVVFAILLISFFVFLTYNDIVRVFGSFMG